MALSPAALVVGATALRSALVGMQLHSGNPGTGGSSNKTSAAPLAPVWTAVDASGNFALAAPVAFTGGAANGTVTYASLWSSLDLTTATWYGNYALSGDLTADSNGAYTVETFVLEAVTS